jgi:hypothetical protein
MLKNRGNLFTHLYSMNRKTAQTHSSSSSYYIIRKNFIYNP